MERVITYSEAIREATEQEMARDPSVVVFGMGVDDPKGIYGTTKGLADSFGPQRVFDTPLSEDAMTGIAIGAALAGLRPIHVHIRMDFLLLAMNQLINMAAKMRYMYGGSVAVPIVVRVVVGRSWGQGPQHSQALHSLFMHIPGLKVVAPTTPFDAKGCLVASIRDNNPVIFVEHRLVHGLESPVPQELYALPLGEARVLEEGTDITLLGISHMVVECLRARAFLQEVGISSEVIDPVSLSPLDIDTITTSVRKTGRLLVVDNAWLNCGASAEILARVVERIHGHHPLDVRRMGFEPVPCPTTRNLEDLFYPNAGSIATTARQMVEGDAKSWWPQSQEAPEIAGFKGPF
jgi:pyruvate/2-oxoglutarate/acetoin dehydrogenase E1 component